MDERYIDTLIERYFAGETTEAEERQLRSFFAADDVPPSLADVKEMFQAMDGLKLPEGFDSRLSEKIDRWAEDERRDKFQRRLRRLWAPMSGVAAAIVLALLATVGFQRVEPSAPQELTPEEVCAQTDMALTLLTSTFKKGFDGIGMAESTTCSATAKAYETINNL